MPRMGTPITTTKSEGGTIFAMSPLMDMAAVLGSLSITFNPNATVPLNGLLRATVDYRTFDSTRDTADNFALPESQPFVTLGAGFRYGGHEPVHFPRLAFELSAWYELEHRTDDGTYGADDRRLEATAHKFLGRVQLNYTFPKSEHCRPRISRCCSVFTQSRSTQRRDGVSWQWQGPLTLIMSADSDNRDTGTRASAAVSAIRRASSVGASRGIVLRN